MRSIIRILRASDNYSLKRSSNQDKKKPPENPDGFARTVKETVDYMGQACGAFSPSVTGAKKGAKRFPDCWVDWTT